MNSKIIGFVLAGLVLLPGCLRVPTYKAKPLKDLDGNFTYYAVKNGVVLNAKCLTHGEMYYLFGERTKQILESVEIIYCSIHNISNEDYVLSLQDEDFLPLRMNEVKSLIKTNSFNRLKMVPVFSMASAGIGLSGIGMATMASVGAPFLGLSYFLLWWYAGVWALALESVSHGVRLLFTTSIIGSTLFPLIFVGKSIVMNGRISKDLKEKMLHDNAKIESGNVRQGLIFVRSADYVPQFSITMHEKNNSENRIVFDVDLQQESCAKTKDNVLPYYADRGERE